MFAQEIPLDGWTVHTNAKEFKPDSWRPGDPILYTGHGSAVFLAPQRNQGEWKSISPMTYPESGTQKLFDTASAANDYALKQLTNRIEALRR